MQSVLNPPVSRPLINEVQLSIDEQRIVRQLATSLAAHFTSAESEICADAISQLALEMPLRLRQMAARFRHGGAARGILIHGVPIDQDALGATPSSWDASWGEPRTLQLELQHALIASLFGEVFGWHTQENGRFFRHIVPIKKDAFEQLGSGSAVELEWHNEEAFHPARADVIAIMCYRNREHAVTTYCPAEALSLSAEVAAILAEPRFVIVPDKSHRPDFNQSAQWSLSAADFRRIEAMLTAPDPGPVLTGPSAAPFIRIDPAFMHAVDPKAAAALATIKAEIDAKLIDVTLAPGDVFVIDNLRAVHGRRPYRPEYGPQARWMRRVNITMDLYKGGRALVAGSKRRFL